MGKTWGDSFLTPWSPSDNPRRDLTPGSTPIRLACASYGLHYENGADIGAKVKRVRDMGYTSAEAGDGWKEASDSEIRELHTALEQYDVRFHALHLCVNNIHPDMAERRKINRRVVGLIETAERLGVSFVVTHTGSKSPDRPTLPHRDNWTETAWKDSVEALNPANINNPSAHLRLREDIGDPRVKVTLDPTNMINSATYYRTTELVNDCFDLLGETILYAHAKDVLWTPVMLPAFEWVVPGEGTMDYEVYLTHLSRMDYPRSLLLEFLDKERYPRAKRFIEETAARLGVKIYS